MLYDACCNGDEVTQGIIIELSRGTLLPTHLLECRQKLEQVRLQRIRARKEAEEVAARAEAEREARVRAHVQKVLDEAQLMEQLSEFREELKVSGNIDL